MVTKEKKVEYNQRWWKEHGHKWRERNRLWNQANATKIAVRKKELRRERWERLKNLKTATGCLKCGETDYRCLEYHHRDPATKERCVSAMLASSWKAVEKEMAKCDLLCANCHCKETYKCQDS